MIARKIIVIYCVALFCITGCRDREVTIELPYEGDRLVLWGKLEAGKPAKLLVRRTFPASGVIPEQTAVTTARVDLFRNGTFYARLFPSKEESGIYASDSLILAGQTYVVRVEMEGFPTAESDSVRVPASLPELRYEREADVPGTTLPFVPQDQISLYFQARQDLVNTYVAVGFLAIYKDAAIPSNWPSADNIVFNEQDCHAWVSDPDQEFGKLFLMNGACIPAESAVRFSVATGNFSKPPNSQGEYDRAEQLTMLLATVSREWFNYCQVEGRQPEGLDHLVLPPQVAYSNIRNGYGIVYGINTVRIPLK